MVKAQSCSILKRFLGSIELYRYSMKYGAPEAPMMPYLDMGDQPKPPLILATRRAKNICWPFFDPTEGASRPLPLAIRTPTYKARAGFCVRLQNEDQPNTKQGPHHTLVCSYTSGGGSMAGSSPPPPPPPPPPPCASQGASSGSAAIACSIWAAKASFFADCRL